MKSQASLPAARRPTRSARGAHSGESTPRCCSAALHDATPRTMRRCRTRRRRRKSCPDQPRQAMGGSASCS
eukprot:327147-Alexandrium_andersonii.AAC.1